MKLNAPDLNCPHCAGSGLRVRELRLAAQDRVARRPSKIALHCGCLEPKLESMHKELDAENVLRYWPWSELVQLEIPRAEGGPKPEVLGNPFPPDFVPPQRLQPVVTSPKPAPAPEKPTSEKSKKRGRAKIKE